MHVVTPTERRFGAPRNSDSPEELLADQIESASRQLADARGRLIAARRRVTELEAAVQNWSEFAHALRRSA